MARFSKKRLKKAGLPPGSMVYIGGNHTESVRLVVMEFVDHKIHEHTLKSPAEITPFLNGPHVFWLQVTGLNHIEEIAQLGKIFALHPLVLEDIVNTAQRPKVEETEHGLFFDLNVLPHDIQPLHSEQISLIFGSHYVLSFQEREYHFIEDAKSRLQQEQDRFLQDMTPERLLYTLQDVIIDQYFVVLDGLDDRLETIEDSLIGNPSPQVQKEIYNLKRDLVFFRRSIWPLRDILGRMLYGGLIPNADPKIAIYYRDLHDHVSQIIDTVESLRDVVAGMLDVYLSSVSNRMNQIMKVLTIISTIFIPLSFIVGWYGMNFEVFPEIHWHYGYLLVWVESFVIAFGMLYLFWKKKWF